MFTARKLYNSESYHTLLHFWCGPQNPSESSVMHRFITGHFYKMNNRASSSYQKLFQYWEFYLFSSWETVWHCGTVQKRNLPISGSGISLSNFLPSSKCTLNMSRILTMPFIPSTPLMPKMPNLQLSWMIFTYVALQIIALKNSFANSF